MATRGVREFLDSYITGLIQPAEPFSGGGQMARRQQPEIVQSPFDRQVTGAMEAAGTLGTGFASLFPAGAEGIFKLARTGSPLEAGQRVEEVQQALTYQPRTQEGLEALSAVGEVLSPLAAPSEFVGQTTLETTGSPALATGAEIFADPVGAVFPMFKGAMAAMLPIMRAGKVVQNAPAGVKANNLPSPLLVEGPNAKATTPVVQSFTPANTEKVLGQIETVKANNPDALASSDNWLRMEDEAMGGEYVPTPPMQAINYNQAPEQLAEKLQQLTPELKAGVDEGFGYVQQIRDVYRSPDADPSLTGRLFLWGILSRGVGPSPQEGAFLDILDNAQPYIDKAARGNFTEADLKSWEKMVSQSLPEGSPGKSATMNANAAGRLLFELGKVPQGSSETVLQRLHGILADPNASGREFRKEFFRLTDKPGIDNKVVSFIGLVGGKDDMLVMDRIQSRHLWDDGRFEGANVYDGIKDGNVKGGLSGIMAGPRGLLITESLEDGLQDSVQQAYAMIGRPEDASVGRMHWETWVIEGNQAVSHSTLQGVRSGTPIGAAVTEGKLGQFSSGVTYRQAINGPITEYPLSDGSFVRMTPERQKEFEAFIKNPKNGIVPKGFKVTSAKDRPWYEMPGVDRELLDEAAREFENANPDGSLKSGARRAVQGGRSVSERRGDFLRSLRRDRIAQLSGRADGRDTGGASGPYAREAIPSDGGDGLLVLSPTGNVAAQYQSAGLNVPLIKQTSADTAAEYSATMRAAMAGNETGAQVEIKSPEDLAEARLFRTNNGSGFAIKDDGDVVAVFASPDEPKGGAYAMLQAAVEAGGRKLDAFDTYLPKIYENVGFRPVARLKWNDEYQPPGWDKEVFREYNNGEPDVVFFVYDPNYQGSAAKADVPYVDEYDEGMALQSAKMKELAPEVERIHGK